ncbi:hypothetical protein Taro_024459 [Colocasia esculenta]|uniref:Uncharacterized protein n=1 Tax=Colocasia esculenta TaxID=4460 RepID=A0A843V0D8_COLES|nr:hypothetical protein [Colocasia esculenta]
MVTTVGMAHIEGTATTVEMAVCDPKGKNADFPWMASPKGRLEWSCTGPFPTDRSRCFIYIEHNTRIPSMRYYVISFTLAMGNGVYVPPLGVYKHVISFVSTTGCLCLRRTTCLYVCLFITPEDLCAKYRARALCNDLRNDRHGGLPATLHTGGAPTEGDPHSQETRARESAAFLRYREAFLLQECVRGFFLLRECVF